MNLPTPAPRLVGSSPYETWALTLRAWGNDPLTPLDHLPRLENDSFTPDTYKRLIKYLTDALDKAGLAWSERLGTATNRAGDSFELQRALVDSRAGLARHLELARHPSLPDDVRRILDERIRDTIERAQHDLEEAIRNRRSTGRVDTTGTENLLRIVKENAFTAVLRKTAVPAPAVAEPAEVPSAPSVAKESSSDPGGRGWLSRFVRRVP